MPQVIVSVGNEKLLHLYDKENPKLLIKEKLKKQQSMETNVPLDNSSRKISYVEQSFHRWHVAVAVDAACTTCTVTAEDADNDTSLVAAAAVAVALVPFHEIPKARYIGHYPGILVDNNEDGTLVVVAAAAADTRTADIDVRGILSE
jgi:hypothetical protein